MNQVPESPGQTACQGRGRRLKARRDLETVLHSDRVGDVAGGREFGQGRRLKTAVGIPLSSASHFLDSGSNKLPLRGWRVRLDWAEVPHSRSLHPDHVLYKCTIKSYVLFSSSCKHSTWTMNFYCLNIKGICYLFLHGIKLNRCSKLTTTCFFLHSNVLHTPP